MAYRGVSWGYVWHRGPRTATGHCAPATIQRRRTAAKRPHWSSRTPPAHRTTSRARRMGSPHSSTLQPPVHQSLNSVQMCKVQCSGSCISADPRRVGFRAELEVDLEVVVVRAKLAHLLVAGIFATLRRHVLIAELDLAALDVELLRRQAPRLVRSLEPCGSDLRRRVVPMRGDHGACTCWRCR